MNILQVLVKLRDDIKTWVTNNLLALQDKIDNNQASADADIEALGELVGEKPVATQISEAIANEFHFSGDYNDLTNRPNITEDDSDNVTIADNNGHVVFKVDAEGAHTTNLTVGTEDSPGNIVERGSDNFTITDNDGRVAFRVNGAGTEAADFTAKSISVDGVDVKSALADNASAVVAHENRTDIHITEAERTKWTNKSDFSGDYNDLTNRPNITEDNSGKVVIADASGNVILRVDNSGVETTDVTGKNITANGTLIVGSTNVKTALDSKAEKEHGTHVTYGADAPSMDGTASAGTAATVSRSDHKHPTDTSRAAASDLTDHKTNTDNPHGTTAEQLGLGNVNNTSDADKPVSTAQQAALDALEKQLSESIVSESTEWTISDNNGYVVATVNSAGLETTAVTAETVSVGGTDVGEKLTELDAHIGTTSGNPHNVSASEIKYDSTTVGSDLKVELGTGGTLGGYSTGETITADTSIQTILKKLLQKAIPATYTKPTVSIANNDGQVAGNVEAGTSITPKLKATFTKNDAGALSSISILKGGTSVQTGTASPLTYNGSAIVIGDETITFTASASYADAPAKTNNLGEESKENWFGAGTVTSGNYSITGKRNMFYGTGVGDLPTINSDFVRALTGKKLAPAQGTSITINVAVGQQYIAFAYPATLRDVNNATYVEANDSGMAANFTKHTVDVADARGGSNGLMSYKVYTYRMAIPAAAAMTFKVTI